MSAASEWKETAETALQTIRKYDTFSTHDKKHINRTKVELNELIKIYEKLIIKHNKHGWYPNNPEERAVMDAATKQANKEDRQVIRAAKRLLKLIG